MQKLMDKRVNGEHGFAGFEPNWPVLQLIADKHDKEVVALGEINESSGRASFANLHGESVRTIRWFPRSLLFRANRPYSVPGGND